MTDEATRERVARAIGEANSGPFELLSLEGQDACRREADAAIAALTGWRDVQSDPPPMDGTAIVGLYWDVPWSESHRKGDVVRCWWQPEFEALISACREMTLHNGHTFEDGSTRRLHSEVIEKPSHWMLFTEPQP